MVDPNNPNPLVGAINNWANNPLGQQDYNNWMYNHNQQQQRLQGQVPSGPPTWANGGGSAITDIATALMNKYKEKQAQQPQAPGQPMNLLPTNAQTPAPPTPAPMPAVQPSMLTTPAPGSTVAPEFNPNSTYGLY